MAHGKAATALRTASYVFWQFPFVFLLIPRQAAVLTSRQGVAALCVSVPAGCHTPDKINTWTAKLFPLRLPLSSWVCPDCYVLLLFLPISIILGPK